MIKSSLLWLLRLYQRFFTLIGYGSCRFYPTCSEYAKWQIQHNDTVKALALSAYRIARCNQLFRGGIDYPLIYKIKKPEMLKQEKILHSSIRYFFVPQRGGGFFVVKRFKETL